MTVVPAQQSGGGGGSSGLYDVLELVLDRGLVIDAFVRVSLVGIEILKIDVRVVVASVDTYLRFAEACNRLDLEQDQSSRTVPELFGGGSGSATRAVGARGAKKAAKAVGGKVKEVVGGDDEDGDENGDEDEERAPARAGTRTRARARTASSSRSRRSRED